MINLQRVSYVRLGTRDIEGAVRFATDVLGLEVSEVSKGAIYFKSDERERRRRDAIVPVPQGTAG